MLRMTRLPEEVTRLLTPLKPYFSYRHHLVFCWLLVAHLVCFGKATVQGLARYTRRMWRPGLCAGCWPPDGGSGRASWNGWGVKRWPRFLRPKMACSTWWSTVP